MVDGATDETRPVTELGELEGSERATVSFIDDCTVHNKQRLHSRRDVVKHKKQEWERERGSVSVGATAQ